MMKVALKEFEQDNMRSKNYGLAVLIVGSLIARKSYNKSGIYSLGVGLLAGSLTYNLFIYKARSYYENLANIVNTNASLELNKVMHY